MKKKVVIRLIYLLLAECLHTNLDVHKMVESCSGTFPALASSENAGRYVSFAEKAIRRSVFLTISCRINKNALLQTALFWRLCPLALFISFKITMIYGEPRVYQT